MDTKLIRDYISVLQGSLVQPNNTHADQKDVNSAGQYSV